MFSPSRARLQFVFKWEKQIFKMTNQTSHKWLIKKQLILLFFFFFFSFFVGRPKQRVLVTSLSQLGLQFLIVHITRTASMVKLVTTKTFSNMHITCVVKTPECSVFIKKSHFVQCSYCKFSTTITTIII